MAISIEVEIVRGPQSSSLNPQEINTSPSRGPLFIIDDIPLS